jgi:hypothetical protein
VIIKAVNRTSITKTSNVEVSEPGVNVALGKVVDVVPDGGGVGDGACLPLPSISPA